MSGPGFDRPERIWRIEVVAELAGVSQEQVLGLLKEVIEDELVGTYVGGSAAPVREGSDE